MRYWFMPFVLVFFGAVAASGQDLKKKKDMDKKEMPELTEFAGKSFSQWQKELHHKDPAEREVAFRAIVMFPLEKVYTALPDIILELEKDKVKTVDLSVRVNGLIAIGKILQAKNSPPPELIKAMSAKKPDQKEIEEIIARHRPDPKIVEKCVLLFRRFLKNDQIILKVRAAQYLPYAGIEARKALPEIVQIANDFSSWEVRKEGLICLTILTFGEKGPDLKLLPEFTKRLDDSSAQVRMTAVSALGQIGSALDAKDHAVDRASILKKLDEPAKSDKDFRVRIAAHVAIMHVNHKPSKEHLSAIMNYLTDLDPRTRLQAIHGMAAAGDEGKKVMPNLVPTLLRMTEDKQIEVATAALATLVQLRAFETKADLKDLKKQYEKANPVLSTAYEDAVDQMDFMIKAEKEMKNKKDMGDKDKKDDKK